MPSSLQGLRSVLDAHFDGETVERLLTESAANYLLHSRLDLVAGLEDIDLHLQALRTATPHWRRRTTSSRTA